VIRVQSWASPTLVESGQAGDVVEIPQTYGLDLDRVCWVPIDGGFLPPLTVLLSLGPLGLASGLTVSETSAAVVRADGVAPSGSGAGVSI
jgi:hypothetical protein